MRHHHVQLPMPQGQEDRARAFYQGIMGLEEVEKPATLAGRGGCWFRKRDREMTTAEIHLGVEGEYRPLAKAHPAFVVDTVEELVNLGRRLAQNGFEVSWEERYSFPDHQRFHCRDPFDNRLEFLSSCVVEDEVMTTVVYPGEVKA